ncbi:hypothetical protein [Magnetospira sp. QH-2]|uniref:hypothetical protein n=1 Tax=Magnetospira sp. (strain QH-2) TaxID=1288970 RepID=UPI0005F9D4F8|nr:hypothetical protein [Magnetospira sp. QH-2]
MNNPNSSPDKWSPGAWTAARCARWRQLEGEAREAFMDWVHAEGWRGHCYGAELPESDSAAA